MADIKLYEKETLQGDEFVQPFKVTWKRLDEFDPGRPPVYPDGLLQLLGK